MTAHKPPKPPSRARSPSALSSRNDMINGNNLDKSKQGDGKTCSKVDRNEPLTNANGGICRKRQWSEVEDDAVRELVDRLGQRCWSTISAHLEIEFDIKDRSGKQIRERFKTHLDPLITKEPWSKWEEDLIRSMQADVGNKWADIAKVLNAGRMHNLRSDNSIKNHWYSCMRRFARKVNKEIAAPPRPQHQSMMESESDGSEQPGAQGGGADEKEGGAATAMAAGAMSGPRQRQCQGRTQNLAELNRTVAIAREAARDYLGNPADLRQHPAQLTLSMMTDVFNIPANDSRFQECLRNKLSMPYEPEDSKAGIKRKASELSVKIEGEHLPEPHCVAGGEEVAAKRHLTRAKVKLEDCDQAYDDSLRAPAFGFPGLRSSDRAPMHGGGGSASGGLPSPSLTDKYQELMARAAAARVVAAHNGEDDGVASGNEKGAKRHKGQAEEPPVKGKGKGKSKGGKGKGKEKAEASAENEAPGKRGRGRPRKGVVEADRSMLVPCSPRLEGSPIRDGRRPRSSGFITVGGSARMEAGASARPHKLRAVNLTVCTDPETLECGGMLARRTYSCRSVSPDAMHVSFPEFEMSGLPSVLRRSPRLNSLRPLSTLASPIGFSSMPDDLHMPMYLGSCCGTPRVLRSHAFHNPPPTIPGSTVPMEELQFKFEGFER